MNVNVVEKTRLGRGRAEDEPGECEHGPDHFLGCGGRAADGKDTLDEEMQCECLM